MEAGENETTIPLAETVDIAAIPGDNGAELRKRKVCMLDEISRFFPLIDGEHVVTNDVSYLTEAWEGFPSHSVVLRQTTNFSSFCYIYSNVQVDITNKQLLEQGTENTERALLLTDTNLDIDFGDVARQLSGGLAGLLP